MLAIVLVRKDIREFDQTISLYTREIGKIEVLAKGIKKIISKNSANLEVLAVVDIEVIQGKDIEYLGRVQPVEFFKNIYADLDKLYLAAYAVKLVDTTILAGERDEEIFNVLISFLEFLDTSQPVSSLPLITSFTIKLWHCLGFSQEAQGMTWVVDNWKNINTGQLNPADARQAYESAFQFAQYHSSSKLAKFIENDRII